MPDWNILGSLMVDLHQEFEKIYYLLLPLFFATSIAFTWFRSPQGSIEFIDVLKRAVISTLLLVAFPEITKAIVFIADGITERIDAVNSLDTFIRMAQEKAHDYSTNPFSSILEFNEMIVSVLAFLSFLVLYIARYITIAMYHFYWIFYTVIAPLLLLFNLFSSTSQITSNLFRGMIEVASWKIVWAIFGAMLTALTFGKIYAISGNYLVIVTMNFVIALAMLKTPKVVSSIVGQGFHSEASTFGSVVTAAMAAAPLKLAGRSLLKSVTPEKLSKFSRPPNKKSKGSK